MGENNVGKNLEALVNKFVIDENQEMIILEKILNKISNYVKIDSQGNIIFLNDNISIKDRIFLIILARYLAVKINEIKNKEIIKNVNTITDVKEIAEIIGKDPKVISARLSELEKEKFVKRVARGKYTIISLNRALEYISDRLEPESDK